MNLVHKTKKLPVITAFILCMGATYTAVADNQGGTRATDQGDSSNIANTMKEDERDINHNKDIKNGADAKKADQTVRKSKQSRKSKTDANSGASAAKETDSSTIGKGTGTPETTTSGSGTGYSVPDK
jgi:hypothetical protein